MLPRPIFRGRTIAGDWVTGSLLAEDSTWYIQDDTTLHPIMRKSLVVFTGRTDRQNRLIFTGDTVRWHGALWEATWNSYRMTFLLRANGEDVPLSGVDPLALERVEAEAIP